MSHQPPFHHYFQKLTELETEEAREDVFVELFHHGRDLFQPLADFLARQTPSARLAPLIDLLGKIMDTRAAAILMRYLESGVPELRRSAANALGWNRARVCLEKLDQMEAGDEDEHVRLECRAAIEEILRDYPNLRGTLRHHKPLDDLDAEIAGDYDEVPTNSPDEEQRIKLMAALPRLLARKYRAVPLHFSPGGKLHLAVTRGHERKLLARLAEITGRSVELHPWAAQKVYHAIDGFYTLGDDDFSTFHEHLTPLGRDEVVEQVIATIHPNEPAGPLNEANDAVEAAQLFISACHTMSIQKAMIQMTPPDMVIMLEKPDSEPARIEPPERPHRERFLNTLRILARLDPAEGLGKQKGGVIRVPFCEPPFIAHVDSEKSIEGERLDIRFEKERA